MYAKGVETHPVAHKKLLLSVRKRPTFITVGRFLLHGRFFGGLICYIFPIRGQPISLQGERLASIIIQTTQIFQGDFEDN